MQPSNGTGQPPESTEGTEGENNGDHAIGELVVSDDRDLKLEAVEEETSNELKSSEEKTQNDGIQSIKERIISTSRLLKILEKQRSDNQATNDKVIELEAQIRQLAKEKEIASKQVDNQSMELEKLRKAHQQQLEELAEVKSERNRISNEITQAQQDKEKAESAKKSYEMLCEQLKAQNAELGAGVTPDEKLRKDLLKMRSLTDQYKAQAQSNGIALKAEQQSHQTTTSKLNSLQRNFDVLEKQIVDLRGENTNLIQTNESLNEQLFEMNLNHQMEINELKDQLEHAHRSLKKKVETDQDRINIPAPKDDTSSTSSSLNTKANTKQMETMSKELEKVKEELLQQTNRAIELDEKLRSANESNTQLEKLKMELKEMKQANERLQQNAETNKKASNTSAEVQNLERRISELQADLTKAHEQISRMRSSPLPTNVDNRLDITGNKFAALNADYQLVLAENTYLKKAKNVLQDKTTDFLVRIDELEKQLRGSIQQMITNGVDLLMDKEVPPGIVERRVAYTSTERKETPVPNKPPLTPSKQIKSSDINKENVRAKKTVVVESTALSPRKRKSISLDTEIPEAAKPTSKRNRKKAPESDKEAVVPVTDYTKLIKDILTLTLSSTPEDIIQHFESARIYTTLKTDLLLHALDAVCTELDTPNVMPVDDVIFEEEFGISEWLVVSLTDSLDVREKRLVWFLYGLSSLNPTTHYFDRLCTWLSTTIISQLATHTSKACRLSRIYINLCKAADDLGRARVFCYDLLRESTPSFKLVIILANFAHSWSSTLILNPATRPASLPADNLIMKCIQLIVGNLAKDHLHDRRVTISLTHFQHCCQWPPLNQIGNLVDFLDDISGAILHSEFPKLRDQDPGKFQEHRFNVLKATELVYYQHRDWEFTYQSFISLVVYPLLQDPFYIDFALELIGKLGLRTSPCKTLVLYMKRLRV
ncbi:hypothetical protein BGW37DRAFT_502171 [Umbelopsis sp. PMI_123]|nr:hypothetical protein BGW37DRAFT_502171 [Umbelopsis sp. PMI_123]